MQLIAAISQSNLIYQDDAGQLYGWVDGMPPRPAPWSLGVDRLLEVGRVKHGMRPIVNSDGAERPEYTGTEFPTLVAGKADGQMVWFLPDGEGNGGGLGTALDPTDNADLWPDDDGYTDEYLGRAEILTALLDDEQIDQLVGNAETLNAFCATGEGGGVDPTCGPHKGAHAKQPVGHAHPSAQGIAREKRTPPPPGAFYAPDVEKKGPHGVTLAARVGVPADSVPPPPKVGRVPNLTPRERRVEATFIDHYEKDPVGVARNFRRLTIAAAKQKGDVPTFGTDDAKVLARGAWSGADLHPADRSQNRATLNTALHQTANAIAKRAFLQHLDTLSKGDEVLVTAGGCGAGKGFALKKVPEAGDMKKRSKVVWDSAGDQNATENPWIQREAEKRGLKVNYLFVHADPTTQWAHPERGVVKRAGDPADGRMVDAKVFADSYALGAKNHAAFAKSQEGNPNASFLYLDNTKGPRLVPEMPQEALAYDRHHLERFALDALETADAPAHVKRGAKQGQRIWGLGH